MDHDSNYIEHVVLIHGLARTKRSMIPLEKRLSTSGYHVVNMEYPSRTDSIEILSQIIVPQAVATCRKKGEGRINFVTHSMGGIILRYYLKHTPVPELGRVVMLSPPNGGSELVDLFGNFFFFRWLYGPAGQSLGTGIKCLPNTLGKVDFDRGVIAGDRTVNPFFSFCIRGKNDGKVSVKRTSVEGM
ncbi:MAG: alpha/beta fold hydrolase, partial [Syntrophales bacterium]|nr:alpha/beta fold hydrolase [Syntrophales bacterium]